MKKKVADICKELDDIESLVSKLRTMTNQVDDNRSKAVEIFDINITDILNTLRNSTDYLLTLSNLYKDKLSNTEINI
jgi:hypothetical protein